MAALVAAVTAYWFLGGNWWLFAVLLLAPDLSFFGLYADTPALVYGPLAEDIHGFDERVNLTSLRRITQGIALFIADWCGVEKK